MRTLVLPDFNYYLQTDEITKLGKFLTALGGTDLDFFGVEGDIEVKLERGRFVDCDESGITLVQQGNLLWCDEADNCPCAQCYDPRGGYQDSVEVAYKMAVGY